MNIVASYEVDQPYFSTLYSAWSRYRSRWSRFAVPLAALFLMAAIAAAIGLPQFRFATVVLLAITTFNVVDVATHRWRWMRKRLKTQAREKRVELVFRDEDVVVKTTHSHGTMQYSTFTDVTLTPAGIFMVPDTGVLVFVPRHGFDSDSDFQRVADTLRTKHASL